MKTLDKEDEHFRKLLAVAAVLVMLLVIGFVLLGYYWVTMRHSGYDTQPLHPAVQHSRYNY